MTSRIEDYALLSDARTAALVSRGGSIDWLCMPRFDSPSMFGALLGDEGHGAWSVRPVDPDARATRRYDDGTFTLVTRWQTADGVAEVVDALAVTGQLGPRRTDLVRRVRGVTGAVRFQQELRIRFDYARAVPWVRRRTDLGTDTLVAIAGPDAVVLRGAAVRAADHVHRGTFTVTAGRSRDLVLTWFPSMEDPPPPIDVDEALASTSTWWREWSSRISTPSPYGDEVLRSLLVLRALTHRDTGGIVAAATTSLPEDFGGSRN